MTKNLKTECADKLKSFDGNISGQDKLAACEELNISRPTLDKYLDGIVPNVDLAIGIIEFFNDRISQKRNRLVG